jgi:hypothetical protein
MSQVNTELGIASTTLISLNQTNVRALAGVPSGVISLSNLWGKAASSEYWFVLLTNPSLAITAAKMAVDASGNVFATGDANNQLYTLKYDSVGTKLFEVRHYAVGGSRGIAVDSSNNYWVSGANNNTLPISLVKFSGINGDVVTSTGITAASSYGGGVAIDSSGNIYTCGTVANNSSDIFIAKFNSSGVIQWQRRIGSAAIETAWSIAVDGTGAPYVVGTTRTSGNYDNFIVKYNTSGTLQWQRRSGTAGAEQFFDVAVTSGGNVYACGLNSIFKYNTSGTLQWQIGLTDSFIVLSITLDSSENIYALLQSGDNQVTIAKFNSSGTALMYRAIDYSGDTVSSFLGSIQVNSTGTIIYVHYGTSTSRWITAKLPGDGSRTGTYGAITYGSSAVSAFTLTNTTATPTLTSATSTYTVGTISDTLKLDENRFTRNYYGI